MKVVIERNRINEVYSSLRHGLENGKGYPHQWKYALAKNVEHLESSVKEFLKSIKQSKEFNEFTYKRIELAKKYADKDSTGKAIIIKTGEGTPAINETFQIIAWEAIFNEEVSKLKEQYKDTIDDYEKKHSEEYYNEEQEIELHNIRVTKEQHLQLEKGEIVVPEASFRWVCKIMKELPELTVVK